MYNFEQEKYVFKCQTAEAAAILLSKGQPPDVEKLYPTPANPPGLVYDNATREFMPELPRNKDDDTILPSLAANWRKLTGLYEESKGEKNLGLLDIILSEAHRKFPDLTLSWSEDYGNCRLIINGAITSICGSDLNKALEGLENLVDGPEAEKIVTKIVLNKLLGLFA